MPAWYAAKVLLDRLESHSLFTLCVKTASSRKPQGNWLASGRLVELGVWISEN